MDPATLIEKMRKLAHAMSILKQEHDDLVAERSLLVQQFTSETSALEEGLESTLLYLVDKK